jgi:putative transcriptional regulator
MFSFIETRQFSKLVAQYLTDEEYRSLQEALIRNPNAGPVIPAPVAFANFVGPVPVAASAGAIESSTTCDALTASYGCWRCIQRMSLTTFLRMCSDRFGKRWKMAKAKRNIGREILEGLRQIKRGEHGRVVNVPDVASIREKTGLSQARFATLLGVSVRTLQDWEQGRRAPSGAARTLLLVADHNPKALLDVA